jgi:flagellar protein FliS
MDLKKARMGIEDNNPKVKGEAISRAISIFTELDCALDHETGKNMSENLSRLYHFIIDRVTIANLKNDLTAIDEAAQVLDQVHDAFKEAARTFKKGQYPAPKTTFENDGEENCPMSRTFSVAV